MPITVETRQDGAAERSVLIGMSTSRAVLGPIAAKWEPGMFASRVGQLVGGWAVAHWAKYRKPPGGVALEKYFATWADSAADRDSIQAVERFLSNLSEEYARLKESTSPDYILDTAAALFNRVRAADLKERIAGHLEIGETDKALEAINAFRKVEIGLGAGINVLDDESAIDAAFSSRSDDLVQYPDALGNFFRGALGRDCFIGMMGMEKIGKSFWIQDLAWRGVEQRRNVAYFEVGDMSQSQVLRRWAARAADKPLARIGLPDEPVTYEYPSSLESPADWRTDAEVQHERRRCKLGLTPAEAKAALAELGQRVGVDRFKLSCHPNTSISVAGIESILETWERDGWRPDCVAEGSLVLTHRGLIPIESVVGSDRLWDGVGWVSHGGVVYKGERDVITYAGLTATPDHQVWTDHGWRTFESCKRLRLRIAHTGEGGREVRVGEDYITGDEVAQLHVSPWREDLHRTSGVCSDSMPEVQGNEVGQLWQHPSGACEGVSFLFATQAVSNMALSAFAKCQDKMREQEGQKIQGLRWQGGRVSFRQCVSGLSVGYRKSGHANQGPGDRQDRERSSLRARQPSIVDKKAELFAYSEESTSPTCPSVRHALSRDTLRGSNAACLFQKGTHASADNREVESDEKEVRKSRVWDIANAGPLSRFTVQGLLVHNCIIVDYADILAPLDGRADPRTQINSTWKALRGLSQRWHALVVTVTQTDSDSYKVRTLKRENFADDKRKYGHVTGMAGINQVPSEKEKGLYRLNWLELRELEFSPDRCVSTAACLALANPAVLSTF